MQRGHSVLLLDLAPCRDFSGLSVLLWTVDEEIPWDCMMENDVSQPLASLFSAGGERPGWLTLWECCFYSPDTGQSGPSPVECSIRLTQGHWVNFFFYCISLCWTVKAQKDQKHILLIEWSTSEKPFFRSKKFDNHCYSRIKQEVPVLLSYLETENGGVMVH